MPDERELRQGAKAAAAAAAVGAAVGVARAIAARAEDAAHRNGGERPTPAEEPEARDEARDAHDEEPPATPQREEPEEREEREEPDEPVEGVGVDGVRRLTDRARSFLGELSGVDVESVSAVDRTSHGWRITLEAVEVRRIPDSTDLLATYDVELDGDGDLVRYERRRRYSRAQSDDGGGR